MEFTVKQVAALIHGTVEGDETLKISQLAKIEEGTPGTISFLSNIKYEPYLYTTDASAVIVDRQFEPKKPFKTSLIRVENAYTGFTKLLEEYQKIVKASKIGIEQPSFLGEGSRAEDGFYLGAFAYVGQHCQIGKNVKIHPQAYVGDHVHIGDNTVIHSGVKIYSQCLIGSHCNIFANAVIGGDGFGFAPQADSTYRAIPQLGNVVIEDHVSIGSNTTIDCATMGSTIIRSGAKIDNLVQIAHNVEIGRNTVIAAQTGIAGSTKLGDNCVIGGQVGFAGHLSIADRTQIGAQSGMGRSVSEVGKAFNGSPATDLKDNFRSIAVFRRLPELEKKLKELENKIKEISER